VWQRPARHPAAFRPGTIDDNRDDRDDRDGPDRAKLESGATTFVVDDDSEAK
jgi:hypothetical protein